MTTAKLTRRTALAGTVALPLAPAAAAFKVQAADLKAKPANADDPFVAAFCDFIDAEEAYINSFDLPGAREAGGGDFVRPYCDAAYAARRRMAETQPVTPLGLLTMVQALVPMLGEPKPGMADAIMDPDAHELAGNYGDDVQEVFIRNLLAGAERVLVKGDA